MIWDIALTCPCFNGGRGFYKSNTGYTGQSIHSRSSNDLRVLLDSGIASHMSSFKARRKAHLRHHLSIKAAATCRQAEAGMVGAACDKLCMHCKGDAPSWNVCWSGPAWLLGSCKRTGSCSKGMLCTAEALLGPISGMPNSLARLPLGTKAPCGAGAPWGTSGKPEKSCPGNQQVL